MKIRSVYFALFLSTASAYIAGTPGSHESPELANLVEKAKRVAPSPDELKAVASHGMLGETNDLMKRLSLGSNYAVASHPEESEDAPVVEEKVEMIEKKEEPKEIYLEEEAQEIVSNVEKESLQEQITPTKVKAMVQEKEEEVPKAKLTIVEEDSKVDVPEELKVESEASEESIITGWDEAEEEDEGEATMTENQESAPVMQEPAIEQPQVTEEPLPYSPYSRQQMIGFSAVDDFSSKYDEKLPRRLVSNYHLNADGVRVNSRPAFVARKAHPNAQASNEAPSATGNENLDIPPESGGNLAAPALRRIARPTAQRIGYLPQEYSCESWFDTKSKVTEAVYGQKKKTITNEKERTSMELANANPVETEEDVFQPSANWFDAQSKVTDAIYGNEAPSLQDKNRKAFGSDRYSYDSWHENPQSNNLFMREGHIE